MNARHVALLAALVVPSFARAAAADAPGAKIAVARAGGGQPALAVGFDASGQLRARVCAADPCTTDGATTIAVPPEAAKLAAQAVLRIVRLGLERKAVVVEISDRTAGTTWSALVAAPLRGEEPIVAWSGYTGYVEGVEGERAGPSILVREEGVYVGTVREGRDLCGRSALLSPRAFDPATLSLKPAKLQRLSEAEMAAAPALTAKKTDAPSGPLLIRASWATSAALGTQAAALTDGKPETVWAEGRGGAGRGEAVVFLAPREVPIAGFELAVPVAPASKSTATVPPKEAFVATDHELFRVLLPDDAAKGAGARYAVALPAPIRTSCVAVVIESASSNAPSLDVGLAEFSVTTAVNGSIPELVQLLSKDGADGDAAAAVLASSGHPAFEAVAVAFPSLLPVGKRRALDVLDEAPCPDAVPSYLVALSGDEAERAHARAALGRCGKEEAATIATTLRAREPAARLVLADELVTAAPGAAVDAIVPLLGDGTKKERRAYRAALARAAETPDGAAAFLRVLDRTDLPRVAAIDVLRSAADFLPRFGDAASRAMSRLLAPDASFRTRFLLLGPASTLSSQDGPARSFLRRALASDPSPLVRAEAARALTDPKPFEAELSRALDDADVRVREASVTSLGAGRVESSAARLVYRFQEDAWPMVRVSAARALSRLGPNATADAALTHAIDYDESPDVRRAALLSAGARGAKSAAPLARARLTDPIETDAVRSAAALSLGLLCDREATDALTEEALKLASPTTEDAERRVAESALVALGALAPPDLPKRVARLMAKTAPGPVRRLALAAVAAKGRCGGTTKPK